VLRSGPPLRRLRQTLVLLHPPPTTRPRYPRRTTLQQMSAPEWRTQQAVIATKRRQLEVWQSRLDGPGLNEATRRHCVHSIAGLERVIRADEAATQQLQDLGTRWVGGGRAWRAMNEAARQVSGSVETVAAWRGQTR
jgi:hypothetical protein